MLRMGALVCFWGARHGAAQNGLGPQIAIPGAVRRQIECLIQALSGVCKVKGHVPTTADRTPGAFPWG